MSSSSSYYYCVTLAEVKRKRLWTGCHDNHVRVFPFLIVVPPNNRIWTLRPLPTSFRLKKSWATPTTERTRDEITSTISSQMSLSIELCCRNSNRLFFNCWEKSPIHPMGGGYLSRHDKPPSRHGAGVTAYTISNTDILSRLTRDLFFFILFGGFFFFYLPPTNFYQFHSSHFQFNFFFHGRTKNWMVKFTWSEECDAMIRGVGL